MMLFLAGRKNCEVFVVQQLERRFVNEFINEELAGKHWQTRVRLGPLPPGEDARLYMTKLRWADICTFEPDIVTIYEAKLEPGSKAVGQLLEYKNLFFQSPHFSRYATAQVNLVLLTSRIDLPVQEICKENGIEYRVFRPAWIDAYEKRRWRI
jgi:hypothetical protein